MEDIIKALADFRNPTAAEHCRQTLQLVIDNAIDTVKNKILDLLEVVAIKVCILLIIYVNNLCNIRFVCLLFIKAI